MSDNPTLAKIDEQVKGHDIVLYMKGSKKLPQCGFSATICAVLERLGVKDYHDVNVLIDPDVRQGIKEYANWPTIPQLYIKGEFIGGADIVRDMFQSGELQTLLKEKGIAFSEQAA